MVEQISSLKTGVKYKDTPAGVVPIDWEAGTLSDISEINPRRNLIKGGDYSFVEMAAIDPGSHRVKYIQSRIYKGSGTRFQNGDTLFARITPCTENGKIAFIDILGEEGFGHGSTEFIVLGPKKNAYPKYIYYCTKWDKVRNLAISKMEGTSGRQKVPNRVFKEDIFIPLPPLSEQKKIAQIISTLDDAIEKTIQVIEKTKDLKKGLMQRFFTQGIGHKKFKKTKIGRIPFGWKVVKLNDVASPNKYSFVDGPFGSNLKSIHYVDQGVPVIQSQSVISGRFKPNETFYISEEKARELERSKVLPGDIVIAKIGVNYGASATVPEDYTQAVLSGNTMKITPNPKIIVTRYLQYLLHYFREIKEFNKIVSITAQPAITLKGAKNLSLSLPKMSEQKKIANILTSTDDQIEKESSHLEQLKQLKKGLMQVLLTGKLRVPV